MNDFYTSLELTLIQHLKDVLEVVDSCLHVNSLPTSCKEAVEKAAALVEKLEE